MAQPNMAQPKVSSTQPDQEHIPNTTSQDSKATVKKEQGTTIKPSKAKAMTEYSDDELIKITLAPNYSSYVSDNTSSTGKANAEISKANFDEKKKAAESIIKGKINRISTPEELKRMYKIYGGYFTKDFDERMKTFQEPTPEHAKIRKAYKLAQEGK
jgi:hypothetical protein